MTESEAAAAPASTFPYSDDFYEDPITDDGVDMVIAYADLPTLTKARQIILRNAAAYGPENAAAVAKGLEQYRNERGVRFYNSHPGVPYYSGNFEEDARRAQAGPAEAPDVTLDAYPALMIGGLVWPLPDGKWQYIDILADGRVEPSTEM
jgi:flagellar motor protein MotB